MVSEHSQDQKKKRKYPQESYDAVVCVVQLEWILLKRIKNNMGDAFTGVETMIRETFLPCIFFRKSKSLSLIVRTLSTMMAKKSGPGLLNPVTSAKKTYLSSQCEKKELILAVTGEGNVFNAYHLLDLRYERREGQKIRTEVNNAKIKGLVADLNTSDHCIILRAKNKGDWMNVRSTLFTI